MNYWNIYFKVWSGYTVTKAINEATHVFIQESKLDVM